MSFADINNDGVIEWEDFEIALEVSSLPLTRHSALSLFLQLHFTLNERDTGNSQVEFSSQAQWITHSHRTKAIETKKHDILDFIVS